MALAAGTRLGPYEILAPLGAGGMGEVYRARDTRLEREVAVKVLLADRLSDPARRARFVQEARAASALNHPHIVTIYEIESAEGIDFIVMELVRGRTLDALIPGPGMRLGEALRIAIPLTEALAAAHAAGIVHRDLKPANVMVTPEGVVKVLDFGLAKLRPHDRADSEEATTLDARDAPLTRAGTVAGTPSYMSPEQASGQRVDARSDIFSFGAVLYEMLTGYRAFRGASSAETLAAVLKEQPKPPSELVPEVPKELERIVLRCLRKEPERRFQHATDLKVELQEVKEESDSQAEAPAGTTTTRRHRRRRLTVAAAAVLILGTAGGAVLWRLRGPALSPPTVVLLTSERLARGGSFSPDGTQIAFSSLGERENNLDIRLKIVGQAEARRLTTDPAPDSSPAWSPDGTQIAFLRSDSQGGPARTYLVSPLGGPERRLSEFPAWNQLSWSPDGRWLAAAKARSGSDPPGGIHLIPVAGGEPRAVTFPKPGAWDVSPSFSPDGRTLAYASCEGTEGGSGNANSVCDLQALPLDSELRPREAARPLTRQRLPMIGLAWTRDGRSIVYSAGGAGGAYLWRVPADGGAPAERVELAGRGAGSPAAALTRDRLVFTRAVWEPDIYRLQPGGSPTPLLVSRFTEVFPQHSPDGRRIVFESGRAGGTEEIWLAEADGSNPVRLTRGPGRYQGSPRWSPDGRSIAFDSYGEDGHSDIWTIGVEGSGLRQLTRDPADDIMPSWSRDGLSLYFDSNRTGRSEIWRVPAGGGAEEQVTHEGGAVPFASLDGRTLYYKRALRGSALLARPSAGGSERSIVGCVGGGNYSVAPRGVFYAGCEADEGPTGALWTLRFWDAASGQDRPVATLEADWLGGVSVSPDGQSILYARSDMTSDLIMIENFR